jgi:hypothetical protein
MNASLHKWWFAVSCALFLTFRVSPALAAITYTTIASGTYETSEGITVSGSSSELGDLPAGYSSPAVSFVPTITGNLTSISLGVGFISAADFSFTLNLDADNPGGGPLTTDILASGELTASSPFQSSDSALVTFNYSGPAISLSTGETYWVVLAPYYADTNVAWADSVLSTETSRYESTDGSTYSNAGNFVPPAYQVSVTPVPEPSACAIFVLGFLGMHFIRRSSKLDDMRD